MKEARTGGSIWELSAPAAPLTHPLSADIQADVLIVGAGFSGLSTALHLQESSQDIVLIEAQTIGWGASGRNGGHVLPLIRKDPRSIIEQLGIERGESLIRMVAGSADYVFSLIKRLQINCDCKQDGWIQAIHSERQLRVGLDRFKQWQRYGASMAMLDRHGVAELLGSKAYVGGLLVKSAGHINPLALSRGMAEAAMKKGIKVYTHTPALSIEQVAQRWKIKTPSGSITASKVVLATSAYSDNLWPGLQKSFLPFYLYNAATRPLDAKIRATILPGKQPVTDTRSDARVFHYDSAGRLITGGTFIFPVNWKDRLVKNAGRILADTFPQIGVAQFEREYLWRGKVSMTADVLPHLHVLAPGVFTWVGCNARGIALSIRMGALLADVVNEVPWQDLPVQAVSMKPVPAHTLSNLMTSVMLAYYRMRDKLM